MKEPPTDHARRVDKNGESIDVRRKSDGSIEVRRETRTTSAPADSGTKDQISVKVYPNIEALRKDDPQAAELLTAPPRPQPPGSPGPMGMGGKAKGGPRTFNVPAPAPQDPRWREWRERFFRGPFGEGEGFEQPAPAPAPPPPAPKVGFDVQPDGKITVHKRDRDADLNVTYANRDEFKQKAPELFKQFEAMEQGMK